MKNRLQQRLRQWGAENSLAALGSLAFAIVVYMLIDSQISNTERLELPVEIERDSGVALVAANPATVSVDFRGTYSDLQQLKVTKPRIVLPPPRNAETSTKRLSLSRIHVRGPRGPCVAKFDPSYVTVTLDHLGEVDFPIAAPDLVGTPHRGAASVVIVPATATISGPKMRLNALKAQNTMLKLEAINVDGRTRSFTRELEVIVPEAARQQQVVPRSVTANVTITPDTSQRTFDDIPVRITAPPGFTNCLPHVTPATVTVKLRGWREELSSLTSSMIRVYAALPATPGNSSNRVPLSLHLPGTNITIASMETLPGEVWLLPQQMPPPADRSTPATTTTPGKPAPREPAASDNHKSATAR